MCFKQSVLGAIFLLCLALLTQAHEESCPNSEKLSKKCTCLKSTLDVNRVFLTCTGAKTEDIEGSFGALQYNGDRYYQIEIADTDLQNFGELPEHMHPQILKFVNVKHLTIEKLTQIVDYVGDMMHLTVDGMPMQKVPKELFGDKHKLQSLNLNGNGIDEISDGAFQHYHSLELLSLENNKLTKIPKAVLTTPANSLTLKLNGNPIPQVNDEDFKMIKEKQIQLFVDSIDCSCTYKDSPFMKWAQETKSDKIICSSPEKFKGTTVSEFMNGKHCSGTSGPVLLSSFVLILAVFMSHLLK